MQVRIFRCNPETDSQAYYDAFEVPVAPEERKTIMDVLDYIAQELDGTLSYFSHSACLHGICGRCTVKCNGKACLACETVLTGEDVTIDPLKPDVIKDLVVRN